MREEIWFKLHTEKSKEHKAGEYHFVMVGFDYEASSPEAWIMRFMQGFVCLSAEGNFCLISADHRL